MLPSAPSPTTNFPMTDLYGEPEGYFNELDILDDEFDDYEYDDDYAEIDSELGEEDDDFV